MKSATTRVLATATASALTIGLSAAAFGGAAHGQIDASDRGSAAKSTGIAHKASGFGTKVTGGQVPAGSDATAFTVIGCATQTGVERENHEAESELPGGAGTASGVKTKLWTVQSGGAVHTYSRNTTANVVLAQSGLGTIELTAVTSLSHAWHDANGFHAETTTSLGSLRFVPPMGEPQEFDLPTPNQPIEIPGLAEIAVGSVKETANDHAGIAIADALTVHLIPSDTKVRIGHSNARVYGGVKHGTFRGSSAATRVSAADDTITSGRTPLSLMPCQGTDGKTWTKQIANLDAGGQIIVEGLRSSQRGKQYSDRSEAMERGSIAGINIGDGALVIDAVAGQANVTRTAGGKVTSNSKGTVVGSITANGETQEFPDTGVIEIPGVAKIERKIVEKGPFGITVIALRITLLDGDGAVIDLGFAKASIR